MSRESEEALLTRRIITLTGEIDDAVATETIAKLLFLESEDADARVELRIRSPGGSMTAGLAIFDTLVALKSTLATSAAGTCGGIAALLLAAGVRGLRLALPEARVQLVLPPSVLSSSEHPEVLAAELELRRDRFCLHVSTQTGRTQERVAADLGRTFTAAEACEYGFVDDIVPRLDLRR